MDTVDMKSKLHAMGGDHHRDCGSIAPNPVEFREAPPNSTVTLTSQRHAEKLPEVGDGQGGLACCDSWGCKESDTTERRKAVRDRLALQGGTGDFP